MSKTKVILIVLILVAAGVYWWWKKKQGDVETDKDSINGLAVNSNKKASTTINQKNKLTIGKKATIHNLSALLNTTLPKK